MSIFAMPRKRTLLDPFSPYHVSHSGLAALPIRADGDRPLETILRDMNRFTLRAGGPSGIDIAVADVIS